MTESRQPPVNRCLQLRRRERTTDSGDGNGGLPARPPPGRFGIRFFQVKPPRPQSLGPFEH